MRDLKTIYAALFLKSQTGEIEQTFFGHFFIRSSFWSELTKGCLCSQIKLALNNKHELRRESRMKVITL